MSSKLIEAINSNDLDYFKIVINDEVACHNIIIEGIKQDNIEMVEYILTNAKVNLNYDIRLRKNPLMYACILKGNYKIIKLLLKHGADPNMQNYNGYNAIMM